MSTTDANLITKFVRLPVKPFEPMLPDTVYFDLLGKALMPDYLPGTKFAAVPVPPEEWASQPLGLYVFVTGVEGAPLDFFIGQNSKHCQFMDEAYAMKQEFDEEVYALECADKTEFFYKSEIQLMYRIYKSLVVQISSEEQSDKPVNSI